MLSRVATTSLGPHAPRVMSYLPLAYNLVSRRSLTAWNAAASRGGICECTGEADPTLHPRITRTVSMGHTDLDVAFEGVAPKPAEEEETIKILLTPAQASDKHLAMEHTAGVASMTLTNISALEHAAPTSKTCHTVCRAAQKASDLIDSLRGAGV